MSKRNKNQAPADPNFEREANKYENPIASRELILEVIEEAGPTDYETLLELLEIADEDGREALRRRLRAMERDGQLVRNRRACYLPASRAQMLAGRVIGHPDGFGFLVPDEGGDDVFLSAREMRSILHGDRVVVRVVGVDRRGRKEGALVEVLERSHEQIVGRYFHERGIGFVVPDNKRISQDVLIPAGDQGEAKDGQIVIATIVEQPSRRNQPIGRITEVLGEHMAPGMEIDVAVRAHELPHEWPMAVEKEALGFGEEVPEPAKEGRTDLRGVPLVTIDGADARDFDDAVFCEPNAKGWRLLVAIADVSHYVLPGNPLDAEAFKRGTSVYFPERVIPMLPEVLSNGLCSINPEVDRLCMVCEMQVDAHGDIVSHRFFDAVMRSHARLTYDQVAGMVVDKDAALRGQYGSVVEHLDDLYALYHALRGARDRRGAIDFETTETKIVFGEGRKIERIVPTERNDAHKIIEECMIAANVSAAKFLVDAKIPALHRVHEGPTPEKLESLREFLGEVGLSLGGGDDPEPKHYTKLLEQINARPDAHLIQTVLLRSLRQAVYSPDPIGHFGLAHEHYTHFTSPIRRYPDLLVHRAIRHLIKGGKPEQFRYDHQDMLTMGEHCSMTERRADEATRDAVDWLKCEYMLDKVGEEFDGFVTTVTGFGLFVELKDIYVEGLVHVTSLANDYYNFDPVGHRMTGERSGRVYRIGDPIRVQVARVDLDERKIDFVPAPEEMGEGGQAGAGGRPAGKKKSGGKKRSSKKRSGGKDKADDAPKGKKGGGAKKKGRKKTA
jgi:ribonuclease R